MARNKRSRKKDQGSLSPEEEQSIQAFEEEYARIEREQGLAAAKAFFRENMMVQCFACGHMGKTVPPLNCARCGMYLD
jgi:hypothetical protein